MLKQNITSYGVVIMKNVIMQIIQMVEISAPILQTYGEHFFSRKDPHLSGLYVCLLLCGASSGCFTRILNDPVS